MPKRITQEQANDRVRGKGFIFGNDYTNSKNKCSCTCIKCEHTWIVRPASIFDGHGCPKCYKKTRQITREEANKRGKKLGYWFGNDYTNTTKKCSCSCIECDYTWMTRPNDIFCGNVGCPECYKKTRQITREEANKRGKKLGYWFGNDYTNSKNKCSCTCIKCDYTWVVRPTDIFCGNIGCPLCSKKGPSKGERAIIDYLDKHNIEYHFQWSGLDNNLCKNPDTGHQLWFDFYLPVYNLIVEYHGNQHFEQVEYWHKDFAQFDTACTRDYYKTLYLEKHGVKLEIVLSKHKKIITEYLDAIIYAAESSERLPILPQTGTLYPVF